MEYIVLSFDETQRVRGIYARGYALEPYPYRDIWLLPADVMDNNAYAEIIPYLRTLPIANIVIEPELEE